MVTKTKARPVTLADVAKDAGVSPMTVSRVINGDEKVKDSTRERVNQSIKKLKYAPNIAARSLAGARALRICLLYGNPSSAYLGELLMGALEAAGDLGAHLIVERTDENVTPEQIGEHLGRDWDALIVPPPISDVAGIRRLVAEHSFPTVFLSSATETGRANEIRIDDEKAAYEITQSLLDKGHTKLGFVKGHPNQTASERRFQGFQRALDEAGIERVEEYVAQGFFTYRSGLDAGEALLSLAQPPTAILASNDDMAAGLFAAAARHGRSVPRDLSIAGFDDSPIATTVWPNLSTVRQPVAEMAARAVGLVWRLGQKKQAQPNVETILLAHTVIERDSVSVPKA